MIDCIKLQVDILKDKKRINWLYAYDKEGNAYVSPNGYAAYKIHKPLVYLNFENLGLRNMVSMPELFKDATTITVFPTGNIRIDTNEKRKLMEFKVLDNIMYIDEKYFSYLGNKEIITCKTNDKRTMIYSISTQTEEVEAIIMAVRV